MGKDVPGEPLIAVVIFRCHQYGGGLLGYPALVEGLAAAVGGR